MKKFVFPSLRSFTLVELLVVISIIVLLAGLAFPALKGAQDSAKKAQTSVLLTSIKQAVVQYSTEYGKLPTPSTSSSPPTVDTLYTSDDSNGKSLLLMLKGQTNDLGDFVDTNNRQITFIEFQTKDLKSYKSGKESDDYIVDAFGNPINIILNYDYNNYIDKTKLGLPSTLESKYVVDISGEVALWSQGTAKVKTKAKGSDLVATWK